MAFLAQEELSPETDALKVSIIQEAYPIKEKVRFYKNILPNNEKKVLDICTVSPITGWQKASPSYCHMSKRGGRPWYRTKIRRTVNSTLN